MPGWGTGNMLDGLRTKHLRFRNGRAAGFSLVELALVVVLLSLLAAIGVPRFSRFQANRRLEAAVRRVVSDLTLAARRSRFQSKPITVKFTIASNRYTLLQTPDPDHPGVDYTVELGEGPYGASLDAVDFGGTSDLIFDGYGVPAAGGFVVLRVGERTHTILVDGATGRVTAS